MKISKSPVPCANRAEMIECDAHAFSVCADIPKGLVSLNIYAPDGSRVVDMSPDEAEAIAAYLAGSAREVRAKLADADYMRELQFKKKLDRQERGE